MKGVRCKGHCHRAVLMLSYLALRAAHPEAQGHILILTPYPRASLALLQAHAPSGRLPRRDGRLRPIDEAAHLGRVCDVSD